MANGIRCENNMKILKPGKVEQRKFVCEKCGCVFVASRYETEFNPLKVLDEALCPTCNFPQSWWDGKPYEEPTQSDEALLADLVHSSNAIDFDTSVKLAKWLTDNGVTFRE